MWVTTIAGNMYRICTFATICRQGSMCTFLTCSTICCNEARLRCRGFDLLNPDMSAVWIPLTVVCIDSAHEIHGQFLNMLLCVGTESVQHLCKEIALLFVYGFCLEKSAKVDSYIFLLCRLRLLRQDYPNVWLSNREELPVLL